MSAGAAAIIEDIDACCEAAGCGPDAILVDAAAAGQFGGTGRTVDWRLLANHEEWSRSRPLILAGGLTPENVAEAIRDCAAACGRCGQRRGVVTG